MYRGMSWCSVVSCGAELCGVVQDGAGVRYVAVWWGAVRGGTRWYRVMNVARNRSRRSEMLRRTLAGCGETAAVGWCSLVRVMPNGAGGVEARYGSVWFGVVHSDAWWCMAMLRGASGAWLCWEVRVLVRSCIVCCGLVRIGGGCAQLSRVIRCRRRIVHHGARWYGLVPGDMMWYER